MRGVNRGLEDFRRRALKVHAKRADFFFDHHDRRRLDIGLKRDPCEVSSEVRNDGFPTGATLEPLAVGKTRPELPKNRGVVPKEIVFVG